MVPDLVILIWFIFYVIPAGITVGELFRLHRKEKLIKVRDYVNLIFIAFIPLLNWISTIHIIETILDIDIKKKDKYE